MPVEAPAREPLGSSRSPRTVVAGLTARRAVRSGALWGYIFGIAIASSAFSYTKLYRTRAQRDALAAAYGSNRATGVLFGPAPRLETVAGFTAFKIGMTLMILGAAWGILTSTRLLRGEEEAGRWELLLTGRTTRRGATGQGLAGLAAGVATLWVIAAAITVVTGSASSISIPPGRSAYFALAMVATSVMFLAVGALTSQMATTRRQAAGAAAVVLGVAYALRMVADAGVGLHGMIWASPLGWVEELAPLTAPRPVALLPIVGLSAVLGIAAVYLAGRRDVGAGILPDRTRARPRLGLLHSPAGLAVRLSRPTVMGWWAAITLSAFLYGLIAGSAGSTVAGSSVHDVLSRLGATGTGAAAVLGVGFLLIAVLVAFVGAGQLTAARGEEASGRLDHLLVRPVSRARWLGGRLTVAVIVLVACGLLAGLAAWLGTVSQHTGVGWWSLLEAGVNLVPPAVAVLGLGVLAFGIAPRSAAVVVYGYLVWAILVVIVGGIGAVDHWVLDSSVFHQMASAPATPPRWEADGVMVAVGLVAALVGGLGFARRDIVGP